MINAEKFKQVFGLTATELWAKPEQEFLKWLNSDFVGIDKVRTDDDLCFTLSNCNKLICQSDLEKYYDKMIAYNQRIMKNPDSDKQRLFAYASKNAFEDAKNMLDRFPDASCISKLDNSESNSFTYKGFDVDATHGRYEIYYEGEYVFVQTPEEAKKFIDEVEGYTL